MESTAERRGLPAHIPALDGLRGLAILLVLCRHLALPTRHAGSDWLHVLTQTGWIGVDLFFVLSGFLITGALYDSKGREGYFRVFYARRALRIFPLYYAFLALYLCLIPYLYPEQAAGYRVLRDHQGWLWLYASNLLPLKEVQLSFGVSHFWSLAVEEQFYLLWPPLVLLLERRGLVRLSLGLIVGAELLRVGCVLAGVSPGAIYGLTLTRVDGLAVGALLAVWMRERGGAEPLVPAARRVTAATGLALAGILALAPGLKELTPLMQTAGYTLLALFFGGLLVLTVAARPHSALSRALTVRPFRFLGRHSYAIYVLHMPVLHFLLSSRVSPHRIGQALESPLAGRIAFFYLAAALSVALAWVTWHLWEKPFLRLKERITHETPPLARPSVVGRQSPVAGVNG